MNFPRPEIDRESAMKLWIDEHSDYAKEQVILNNIGVVGLVLKSVNLNPLDEDLFATGIIGVVKAVNTFKPEKGFAFSTYATPIIRNEILMTLRKKRIIPAFSLDEPCHLRNGESIDFSETIADDKDFEEEIIAKIQTKHMLALLGKEHYKIVRLKIDGKTQREIAEILGISQPQVSRIIKKICKKCREEFVK